MRVAFFVLLFANVLFMAWATWVDVEPLPRASATQNLPPLKLADEAPQEPATPEAPPAEDDPGLEMDVGPIQTAAASRCVSVGPFGDLTRAARAAAMLRERGFAPEQRAEEGETWAGYWVYIAAIKDEAEERRVLRALERARIQDAHAMPSSEGRRVSLGLFTERERAERRARAVERLGFEPQITERRQTGTVYWVDIDLQTSNSTVPTEGLLSLEGAGSRIEIRVCPEAQRRLDVAPALDPTQTTTAAAGTPRPG